MEPTEEYLVELRTQDKGNYMISQTKIKVRYVETDQMGIVHHSNYFNWFEVGRTEFFNQIGLSYKEIESSGIVLPLINANCNYKIPAKYEDELIIQTRIEEVKFAKSKLVYEVIRITDNKVLATGYTVHAFANKLFKPINLKRTNEKLYNILLNCI